MRCRAIMRGALAALLALLAPAAGVAAYAGWTVADVDTGLVSNYARNSLAVDADGVAHIAYMDFTAKDVKYARPNGPGWLVEVVEDGAALDTANITAMPGLALDSQGYPHIVYAASRDGAFALIHAVRDATLWTYETIATSTDWFYDWRLVLDASDTPHVAYSIYTGSRMDLHYRVRDVGGWSDSLVGEGDQAALVLDAEERPVIVFRGWTGSTLTHLRCAMPSGEGWAVEELAYLGSWPDVALDSAGVAHLTTKLGSWVYYATNASGAWAFTPICQTITDARHAAIGIGRFGEPVIVCLDNSHVLRLGYRQEEAWSLESIDTPTEGTLWGNTPSLAFDSLRMPRVAFRGPRGLRLASGHIVSLTPVDNPAPDTAPALSARPNPFNPLTTLSFHVATAGRARLEVYDVAGRLVRTILDADLPPGSHTATWDGRDSQGRAVASGSYFARLAAGGRLATVRMGLVR